MVEPLTAAISALLGGGLVGAVAKYRLGKLRLERVDAPHAEADAFQIAMKAQLQLNEATQLHVATLQTTIAGAMKRIEELERQGHEKDTLIARLEDKNAQLRREVNELEAQVEALKAK